MYQSMYLGCISNSQRISSRADGDVPYYGPSYCTGYHYHRSSCSYRPVRTNCTAAWFDCLRCWRLSGRRAGCRGMYRRHRWTQARVCRACRLLPQCACRRIDLLHPQGRECRWCYQAARRAQQARHRSAPARREHRPTPEISRTMRQCRCDLWIFQVLFQAVIISLARTALKSAFFRRDSSDNCEEPFHRFCVSQALLSGCECWGPSFYNRTGIELLHVPRICSYTGIRARMLLYTILVSTGIRYPGTATRVHTIRHYSRSSYLV